MTASLPRLSECNTCHAPIRFVRMTESGRAMPVNPKPTDRMGHGTVAARLHGGRLEGFVTSRDRQPGPRDRYLFTPHYATCQKAAKPTVEPEPALF